MARGLTGRMPAVGWTASTVALSTSLLGLLALGFFTHSPLWYFLALGSMFLLIYNSLAGFPLRRRMVATYHVFGIAITCALAIILTGGFVMSTLNGILGGEYVMLIPTDLFGENYAELLIVLLALPEAILVLKRELDRVVSAP